MSLRANSIEGNRLVEALGIQADRAGRFVMTFPSELTWTMKGSPMGSNAECGTLWMFWNLKQLETVLPADQQERIEKKCILRLAQVFFCPLSEVRKAWQFYQGMWKAAEADGISATEAFTIALTDRLGLSGNHLAEKILGKYLKNNLVLGWPLKGIMSGTTVAID